MRYLLIIFVLQCASYAEEGPPRRPKGLALHEISVQGLRFSDHENYLAGNSNALLLCGAFRILATRYGAPESPSLIGQPELSVISKLGSLLQRPELTAAARGHFKQDVHGVPSLSKDELLKRLATAVTQEMEQNGSVEWVFGPVNTLSPAEAEELAKYSELVEVLERLDPGNPSLTQYREQLGQLKTKVVQPRTESLQNFCSPSLEVTLSLSGNFKSLEDQLDSLVKTLESVLATKLKERDRLPTNDGHN